ncbi:MAG: tRNA pseudouridine(38-40) synthase TruA [Alphaproteobacteria bacterium]|nr:tRNA pseudouridine(38-40) synthase TruA [Alphaproteobacteria bacterium]
MTQRYKFTIEYNGSGYAGWQRQEEDLPTIQGEIEKAIHKFSAQDVQLQAAGRTDAGVHARAQVAHGDFEDFTKPMEPFEIAKAINAYLRPQPISIIGAEPVDDDFHARFAAKNKLYTYRILNRPAFPALEQGLVWHLKKPLDAKAMHDAGQVLLGHHDFSSFRDSQCQAKNAMRTLDRLDVRSADYDQCGGQEILIEAEGQSFLHHMVRNVVGTLAQVGEGKWTKDDVKNVLEAKDRTKAGPTAPADGLCLSRIDYPKEA